MTSIATDYLYWDNTEAVTLTLKRENGNAILPITVARRNQLSEGVQTSSELSGLTSPVTFCIPAALVSESIRPGDVITDSEQVSFTVESVSERRLGSSLSHYTCVCTKHR